MEGREGIGCVDVLRCGGSMTVLIISNFYVLGSFGILKF